MSGFRTASRYASAILSLAKEHQAVERVHSDMQLFLQVCDQNPAFRIMLKNPIINHEKKFAVLNALFSKNSDKITMSFFDIIRRKKREALLPEIAKEFHNQYNKMLGITHVAMDTAVPLTSDQKSRLLGIVEGFTKGKVELREQVKPDLIGGFVLTIGDKQIDESVKRKLTQIKTSFKSN